MLSHSSNSQAGIVRNTGEGAEENRVVDQESQEYFRRRELIERAAAKNASTQAARRVHQELAQEYAQLLRGTDVSAPARVTR
jgi:hypothetical protein